MSRLAVTSWSTRSACSPAHTARGVMSSALLSVRVPSPLAAPPGHCSPAGCHHCNQCQVPFCPCFPHHSREDPIPPPSPRPLYLRTPPSSLLCLVAAHPPLRRTPRVPLAAAWCSTVKLFIGFTISFHNHGEGPTRAFSRLKVPTSAFTFKTLLRQYMLNGH